VIAVALLALAQAAPPAERPRPCYREEVQGGVPVQVYLGDRVCVDLTPPRTFVGVWIDEFEGSRFVEGARSWADAQRDRRTVWLNPHDPLKRGKVSFGPRGHAYRVTFVGRQARDGNRKPLEGYGHFGMGQGLVVVDEFLSAEDLGDRPVPPAGQ